MKSQQINFFLSPDEFGKLSDLVHSLGFVILQYEVSTPEVRILPSLSSINYPRKVFALTDQLPLVVFKSVNDYYLLNEIDSPVISFSENRLSEQQLNRGRFYFTKETWKAEPKNEAFIKKSQTLFRQFKKTFPDAALEGFAPFWVSPQAAQLHREGYTLQM
jgi:hypothetical protein